MTYLTPDHPAVEAAARAAAIHGDYDGCFERVDQWNALEDWEKEAQSDEYPTTDIEDCEWWTSRARAALNAALPHLTADDLRGTDAAEEIRTEGWMQGWAAGRDLDGDEDATPYLRHTPAGRALMAEAWDQGAEAGERDYATALDPGHECIPNPYRESAS